MLKINKFTLYHTLPHIVRILSSYRRMKGDIMIKRRIRRASGIRMASAEATTPKKAMEMCNAAFESLRQNPTEMDAYLGVASAMAQAGNRLASTDMEDDDFDRNLVDQFCVIVDSFADTAENAKACDELEDIRIRYGLSSIDTVILLTLTASAVGMGPSVCSVEDVQRVFSLSRHSHLDIARMLSTTSPLIVSELVFLEINDPFKRSQLSVAQSLLDSVLQGKKHQAPKWDCETQEELLDKLYIIRRALSECANEVESKDDDSNFLYQEKRECDRLIKMFKEGVKPDWPLANLIAGEFLPWEQCILIGLTCKAHIGCGRARHRFSLGDTSMYTGDWLARSAAKTIVEVPKIIRKCLAPSGRLISEGFIAPAISGLGEMLEEDEDTLRTIEFELTDAFIDKLGINKKNNRMHIGRKPLLRMDQLVLQDDVREALELAANQFSCKETLEEWDIGGVIPYGNAVTLLFSGPPGVGKTACAEALADRLGKNILIADYSALQSCWVGATEKNIVSLFSQAKKGDCVLFWDEADAMFFDRDSASRNWEVRDVNVLLQELEKFNGVCILATNRKATLDKALARRISLKVEFDEPTREMSRRIWEKLLPPGMPLASDVELDTLAKSQLTGGEIKNVILNAARQAAGRGKGAQACMQDFLWALQKEEEGKDFSQTHRRKIGF